MRVRRRGKAKISRMRPVGYEELLFVCQRDSKPCPVWLIRNGLVRRARRNEFRSELVSIRFTWARVEYGMQVAITDEARRHKLRQAIDPVGHLVDSISENWKEAAENRFRIGEPSYWNWK